MTAMAQKHSHVPSSHDGTTTSKSPNFWTARWDSCAYSTPDSALLASWSDSTRTLDTSLSGVPPQCIHRPPPPFVLIQPMHQATTKKIDVCILTSSIRSINPHDIPCNNIHPNLVPQSAFPFKLEQRKKGFLGWLDPAVGCVHQCHLHWWGNCSDCRYLSCFQKQSWGNKVSIIWKISLKTEWF